MKCYLHIGTEKTATTTLQSFLNLNREILYRNGIIFTKCAGSNNNIKLAIAAYDPYRRDDLTISMGIKSTGNDLEEFQQKTIHNLSKEIKGLACDDPEKTIIFSSEHFQSRLTRKTEIQRLHDILIGFGNDEIKVIVYLRDPVEIANSLYSTAIKSGHLIKLPPPPDNFYFNNVCNHKQTLEKFASIFGEDSLIPRLFNKSDLINGSIIEDFLNLIGLPRENSYQLPAKMNKILSMTGLNILRKVNEKIPRIMNDRINPLRADIVNYFEKHFSGPKYMMPLELFEKYNEAFRESNEWVRYKYFPHKESLFPKKSYQEQGNLSIQEEELDRIAAIIADIWLEKQNKSAKD